jgi:hypothetical protein
MDPKEVEKKVKAICRKIVVDEQKITAAQVSEATGEDAAAIEGSLADDGASLSLKTTLAIGKKNPEPVMAAVHEFGFFMVKHPPAMADVGAYDKAFLESVSMFNQLSATMRKALDNGDVSKSEAKQISKEAADVLLIAGSIYTLAKKTASGG